MGKDDIKANTVQLYYRRAYLFLIAILLLLSITVFTFLLQGDHTRTAAYAFPLFFVAMAVVQNEFGKEELRATLLIIGLISTVFSPILY